mmetsp:Transcript_14965/g.10458  ORF Transcript_14965/g.10458 Transcript_14965/m.10458 type:complete len:192 (-) Transcript_14965:11-586(-)
MGVDPHEILKCLMCIKHFKNLANLQKAVINFVVRNLFTEEDNDFYQKIFYSINTSADGMLTRRELLIAYWRSGFKTMSEVELDSLVSVIDSDTSGVITFSEFIVACVHPEDVLSSNRLLSAFKTFDKDGSGAITVDELRESIEHVSTAFVISEHEWSSFFGEYDEDGNDELGRQEFILVMQKLFKGYDEVI